MKFYLLFVAALSLAACQTSPGHSQRSIAERLNGDSYESSVFVGPVPVHLQEKPISRQLSGRLFCGTKIPQIPANNASILILAEDGQIVASASANMSGQYSFTAPLKAATAYMFKAEAPCGNYEGEIAWLEERSLIDRNFNLE